MDTQDLALKFADLGTYGDYVLECQPIPGDVGVIQVTLEEFEELPCFISITDTQILCITYLFEEQEIDPEQRSALLEEMLELNIPIPLSSFSKVGDHYVMFGALAVNSSFDEICHEVITLCENSVEAITALEEFLV